jgi:hypothetical protein
MACVLVLAQGVSSAHKVVHAGGLGASSVPSALAHASGASAASAASTASDRTAAGPGTVGPVSVHAQRTHGAGWWGLLGGHESGSLACAALDHLGIAAVGTAPLLTLALAPPPTWVAAPAPSIRPSATPAGFLARGPPAHG